MLIHSSINLGEYFRKFYGESRVKLKRDFYDRPANIITNLRFETEARASSDGEQRSTYRYIYGRDR